MAAAVSHLSPVLLSLRLAFPASLVWWRLRSLDGGTWACLARGGGDPRLCVLSAAMLACASMFAAKATCFANIDDRSGGGGAL